MRTSSIEGPAPTPRFSRNFWIFWVGQSISNLGSAFTTFALPLLIFKLTGSALNLAAATAVTYLPYLLFGLVMGAWVDRTDRRRLMIMTDVARALLVASIPILTWTVGLPIWYIYVVMFLAATLMVGFNSAQLAAIPSLVNRNDLIAANSRFQGSYSAAQIIGPALAGVLIAALHEVSVVLLFDALTFLISVVSLTLIKASFNAGEKRAPTSLRHDIAEGLRYVWNHPVLRNISIMVMLCIFLVSTVDSQIVLFAKRQLQATDTQVGLLYTAGGVGFFIFSLLAGTVRKYSSFSGVILGTTMVKGLLVALLGLTPWYWVAVPLWGACQGMNMLFNVNTTSLRQTIVPGNLLGRVLTISAVLAWSTIPVDTFIGGFVIEWTKNVGLVYTTIGILMFLVGLAFVFTPLGHAERYLPQEEPAQAMEQARA